eukprot:jgi/Ulvmu1/5567/UM023_0104.1
MQASASASTTRLDRLRKSLQQENSKELRKVPYGIKEARHRQCALSTHATLPPSDHRVADPAEPATARTRAQPVKRASRLCNVEEAECMPATDLQGLSHVRQQAVMNSEWALLSAFDAQKAIDEAAQRKQHIFQQQQHTRQALDGQMQELRQRAAAESAQKEADKQLIEHATAKFHVDERNRVASLQARHMQMKEEAVKQIQQYRHKQAQKMRIKMEDENLELQQIQRELQLEQQKAAEDKRDRQAEQERWRSENEARIVAKQAAREHAMADDRRLMEETLRTLEANEQQRLKQLHDFHEMIAKRGENVGKQVLKEAHDRAEREERLIREMEIRKAREDQEKLAATVAAKAKMQKQVDQSRRCQLQLREQLQHEAAQEEAQLVAEVEAKAKHAAYAEKLNTQARRLAAVQNQQFIRKQMAEKKQNDFLDDTDMSNQEKQFMKPVLTKARLTVKGPRHINIF